MKRIATLGLTLLLLGCDRSHDALQSMAQCKLDKRAEAPVWNETFLQNCMEAKGLIRDDSLMINQKFRCSDDVSAPTEAACYRRSN
ncbi:MAG TPA: hypothetical protein VGF97_09725 [Rhizomicrobium sp.]